MAKPPERERFEFYAVYDDVADRIRINRTTVSEHETPKRGWVVDGRETVRDFMVLRRAEFLDLVTEGFGALSYNAELVRNGGIRVDGSDESVYATKPVPVRES